MRGATLHVQYIYLRFLGVDCFMYMGGYLYYRINIHQVPVPYRLEQRDFLSSEFSSDAGM